MLDDRRFHETRDAVENSLGGAFANMEEALDQFDQLTQLVDDRAEVDQLRGATEAIAHAIERVAAAIGHITPDGARQR